MFRESSQYTIIILYTMIVICPRGSFIFIGFCFFLFGQMSLSRWWQDCMVWLVWTQASASMWLISVYYCLLKITDRLSSWSFTASRYNLNPRHTVYQSSNSKILLIGLFFDHSTWFYTKSNLCLSLPFTTASCNKLTTTFWTFCIPLEVVK